MEKKSGSGLGTRLIRYLTLILFYLCRTNMRCHWKFPMFPTFYCPSAILTKVLPKFQKLSGNFSIYAGPTEMPLKVSNALWCSKIGESLVSFHRCAWALGHKIEKKNVCIRPQTCSYVAGGNSHTQRVEHEVSWMMHKCITALQVMES